MIQTGRSVRSVSVPQPSIIGRMIRIDMAGNSNLPETVPVLIIPEKPTPSESAEAGKIQMGLAKHGRRKTNFKLIQKAATTVNG